MNPAELNKLIGEENTQRLSQLLRERHITKNQLIEDLLVRVATLEAKVQTLESTKLPPIAENNAYRAWLMVDQSMDSLYPEIRAWREEAGRQIDAEVAAALERIR